MTTPVPIQFATGQGSATLASTPTAGNLLTVHIGYRVGGPGAPAVPSGGWTTIEECLITWEFGREGGCYWRLSNGVTTTFTSGIAPSFVCVIEWPAGSTVDVSAKIDGVLGVSGVTLDFHSGGPITPTQAATIVGFGILNESDSGVYDITFEGGTTVLLDAAISGSLAPRTVVGYQTDKTAATSVDGDMAGLGGWAGVSYAVIPGPSDAGVIVDFEDDGFDVGDDDVLTTDVVDWVITRGAAAEITGGANPGSAVVHVRRKERDGKYNPRNASSPLYPNLRDGLRGHISVNDDGTLTAGGTVKGLFAGRTTDITVLPDSGPDDAVITEIAFEDPLAWYGRTPVHIADSRTRSHRELRLAVLAAIGEARYTLDSEIGTMPLSSASGDAFAVLGQINAANGTRHFAKPHDNAASWYRYTTYNRQHKLSGVADATVNAGVQHATDTSGWRLSADTVINQQRASVDEIAFLDAARIVWTHDALPFTIRSHAPGHVAEAFDIWAEYPDFVDGATIEYDYTGTAPTVTLTSFGHTGKVHLVTAGTTVITQLSIRGYEVVRGDAQSYVADDLVSQAEPRGIRAGSDISGDYVGVLAMAAGIAEHIVWRYGNPQMRPTLTVHNWFPEMFELDLYDVIAFTSGNLGADAVLFEIVGLTHTAYVAAPTVVHHTVQYVLQESRVQTDPGWFVLDTSLLDSASILAY